MAVMFTGIIEAMGEVTILEESTPGTFRLEIRAALAPELRIGDSLSNNGCCLTVISRSADLVAFDLLAETAHRTNLSQLKPGGLVNLERPMAANGRFDGHIVQGHVDATAQVLALEEMGQDHRIEIELPREFWPYIVFKGSVTVNGISLTVADLTERSFSIWIIPHTWSVTNLKTLQPSDRVNLEFDLIAKYVERMVRGGGIQNSESRIQESGARSREPGEHPTAKRA
jgi:riboflavin synthase